MQKWVRAEITRLRLSNRAVAKGVFDANINTTSIHTGFTQQTAYLAGKSGNEGGAKKSRIEENHKKTHLRWFLSLSRRFFQSPKQILLLRGMQ